IVGPPGTGPCRGRGMASWGSMSMTWFGPPPLGPIEQLAEWQGEARQDRAAVERLIFAEQGRLVGGYVNSDGALPGIDEPDQDHAGLEVFPHLALHLPLRVALAEDFHG